MMDFEKASVIDVRRWLWALQRRMMSAHEMTKSLLTVGLIVVVGYTDLLSGDELSFSIFYLLPIAYATWFIGGKAGLCASVVGAAVWFSVDTALRTNYSRVFIPIWNMGVRLVFFCIGVAALVLLKQMQSRLLREVSRRTRGLR